MTDQSTPTIINTVTKILLDFLVEDEDGNVNLELARTKLISEFADFAERITPEGCSWCDYKGYTETGGMAMEDDLVEKEPCEYCSEIRDLITQNVKAELGTAPINSKEENSHE
jgi:hypothetical protein